MADTTWRDALLLAAPRIAGVPVRPLSAWHCHVAQQMEVRLGLCEDGRGPTPGDIAHAIAICRSRYSPDVAGVPAAGWWLRRVYLPIRWLTGSWRVDAMAMVNYVEAYRRYPATVKRTQRDTTPLGAPPYFAVAVDVAARLPSLSLAEALNMPLIALYCLRAALLELDGGPACSWHGVDDPGDVQAALAAAQAAIARYNAGKGVANG
jgi:hypothetical protein